MHADYCKHYTICGAICYLKTEQRQKYILCLSFKRCSGKKEHMHKTNTTTSPKMERK
jgi:hypothetical protein